MFEMSTAAEELLAQALKLAPEGREILAVQLIGSLEQPPCYDVDWDAEIKRRSRKRILGSCRASQAKR